MLKLVMKITVPPTNFYYSHNSQSTHWKLPNDPDEASSKFQVMPAYFVLMGYLYYVHVTKSMIYCVSFINGLEWGCQGMCDNKSDEKVLLM